MQTAIQWAKWEEVQQLCINLTIKISLMTYVGAADAVDLSPDSSSQRERHGDKLCYRMCVCVCFGAAGLTAVWWLCVMKCSQKADQSNENCMAAADTPGPGSPEMDTHSRTHIATTSP